jgi:hypothetical protein
LERLVHDIAETGKQAIAMVIEHDVHDISRSVPVADCKIREIYYHDVKQWKKMPDMFTAGTYIKMFIDYVEQITAKEKIRSYT